MDGELVSNIGDFVLDMRLAADVMVPAIFVMFTQRVSLDFLGRLMQRNPVKTGHSRANWQLDIWKFNDDELARFGVDHALSFAEAASKLRTIDITNPYCIVFLFNNVPYIWFLEEGGSRQAPQGFVHITLREMESVVQRAEEWRIA